MIYNTRQQYNTKGTFKTNILDVSGGNGGLIQILDLGTNTTDLIEENINLEFA